MKKAPENLKNISILLLHAKTDMKVFSWNKEREIDTIMSPNDSINITNTF